MVDSEVVHRDVAAPSGSVFPAREDLGDWETEVEPPKKRLTADLPAQDADTLARIAQFTGFNKVTTLIRAIRVLAELVRAESKGGEVMIKYPDGTRERLIIR
jgi:hypothetical protein